MAAADMSSASGRQYNPLTLQRQSFQYIVMYLEQFPTSSLAQLPLSVRKDLLWSLPIADVCQLEKTSFISGIEMEAYWNEKPRVNQDVMYNDIDWPFTSPIQPLDLPAKEWCYGMVAHNILMTSSFLSPGPPKEPKLITNISNELLCKLQNSEGDDIVTYLFAFNRVTSESKNGSPTCDIVFPLRYASYDVNIAELTEQNGITIRSVESLQCLVNAAVHCFGGELPKVFQIGYQPQSDNIVAGNVVRLTDMASVLVLVDDLRYLAYSADPGGITSIEVDFVRELVWRAINLEVLILNDDTEYPLTQPPDLHLDDFFTELSTLPFLSKFCSLVLICRRFVVSQSVLDEFLRKFLSTPCAHPQTIKLAYVTVENFMLSYFAIGARPPTSPFWDQLKPEDSSYLHLKSIEFVQPRFAVRVPLTGFVSDWSGQSVHREMGTQTSDVMSSFIITFPGSRKRPHTEVDE